MDTRKKKRSITILSTFLFVMDTRNQMVGLYERTLIAFCFYFRLANGENKIENKTEITHVQHRHTFIFCFWKKQNLVKFYSDWMNKRNINDKYKLAHSQRKFRDELELL